MAVAWMVVVLHHQQMMRAGQEVPQITAAAVEVPMDGIPSWRAWTVAGSSAHRKVGQAEAPQLGPPPPRLHRKARGEQRVTACQVR